MTKAEKIKSFDPNSIGLKNSGMFGLPFTNDECETILIPVPWEVTVSYGGGTIYGPSSIMEASYQVDLFDPLIKNSWHLGIAMDEISQEVAAKSTELRGKAEECIEGLSDGETYEGNAKLKKYAHEIHEGCLWMNMWVKEQCLNIINQKKIVGLIGGDHSTPLGMMQALAEKNESFAILQLDAHADLRNAYEGFEFSHASIMYNALKIEQISKLVQVGIRDYCEEEFNLIQNSKGKIKTFFDRDIKHTLYRGDSWDSICNQIVNELPENIYLSFDIDALDPKLCPNTGTPVAGGFETEEILYLLEKVVKSGKKILAFDVNEVSPAQDNDWDANVAARMLYRICNLVALSQGKIN